MPFILSRIVPSIEEDHEPVSHDKKVTLRTCFGAQTPLYSGLSIMGGSHSPSISSSQSSGLTASGSGICSGLSQSSGFLSSGSGMVGLSSQSSGFLACGSWKITVFMALDLFWEVSLRSCPRYLKQMVQLGVLYNVHLYTNVVCMCGRYTWPWIYWWSQGILFCFKRLFNLIVKESCSHKLLISSLPCRCPRFCETTCLVCMCACIWVNGNVQSDLVTNDFIVSYKRNSFVINKYAHN